MSTRIELEKAYVLHTRPFRETSLIVDCFSENHGKIGLIAKGARRAKSANKGMLRPFSPLLISYLGRSELKTLTHCELNGGLRTLSGERLAAGFYLNELLMRLVHPHVAFIELFHYYEQTLTVLAEASQYTAAIRLFEKHLLQALGYELMLQHDHKGETLIEDAKYLYLPEQGPILHNSDICPKGACIVSSKALLCLANDELTESTVCAEAKKVLHTALRRLLGDKPIQSSFLIKPSQEA